MSTHTHTCDITSFKDERQYIERRANAESIRRCAHQVMRSFGAERRSQSILRERDERERERDERERERDERARQRGGASPRFLRY